MKQILQNLRNGETLVDDIPAPMNRAGHLTIRSRASLVSVGTEKMLVDFGKSNLIQKAMQQPDKVRQVVDKIRTDGLVATLNVVRNKLDTPLALGYCNVGVISYVGDGVSHFQIGDRVISNGKHAELVVVPKNLCAKIPDNVDDESASFTVLGAIALQGIRLLAPTLGETFVVTGLGLIGLMAVQILRASGCRVIGLDYDQRRCELAKSFGAEIVDIAAGADPVRAALEFTAQCGVDGVLLTASTTSSQPVAQAAQMCRKRGRIVLVGVVGLELSRADFYEKELSFQVSCSYGPGRYDANYEEQGHDYPIGFVRWTEERNFCAILQLMAEGKLNVKPLISHRFLIEDAEQAYANISVNGALGIIIEFPRSSSSLIENRVVGLRNTISTQPATEQVCIGVLGAGNYAESVLVPQFAKTDAVLQVIVSASGVSSTHVGKKFGFAQASSDQNAVLKNPQINAVVIATRHNSHAKLVAEAWQLGKHIFVEKPLAISRQELKNLEALFGNTTTQKPLLMVGFNRRYSPHVQKIKSLLTAHNGSSAMVMTVNAGAIDSTHWTQDRAIGGGRIVGEVCHFVDLLRFLNGCAITSIKATFMNSQTQDSVMIILGFANGSVASINYLSNGNKSFPKERLEIFAGGGIIQLDNFKSTKAFRWPGFKSLKTFQQDKGQTNCVNAFVKAVHDGDASKLIPLEELIEVTRACFTIEEQLAV